MLKTFQFQTNFYQKTIYKHYFSKALLKKTLNVRSLMA